MKPIFKMLLIAVLFCMVTTTNAATYYVDPLEGDDGGPGTSEPGAWRTMEQVESDSTSGDTVMIMSVDEALFASDWPGDRTYRAQGVTQHGITWTFDDYYNIGRFANGDWWVLAPEGGTVDVIEIDPASKWTEEGDQDEFGEKYHYARIHGLDGVGWERVHEGGWAAQIKIYFDHTIQELAELGIEAGANRLNLHVQDSGDPYAEGRPLLRGTAPNVMEVDEDETGVYAIFQEDRDIWGSDAWPTITARSGKFGGELINGSQINVPLGAGSSRQGYATEGGTFDYSLTVGIDVSGQKPLEVSPHSSLISTESRVRDTSTGGSIKTAVQRASILTVIAHDAFDNLPEGVEPGDCFRPGFYGDNKDIKHWTQQLDTSFLQSLEWVGAPGDKPGIAEMEDAVRRPWISKDRGMSRWIHPRENMPEYWLITTGNNAAVALNLDYTSEEKEMLVIYYAQLGIDMYKRFEEGSQGNPPDGGIFSGRLLPVLTAGRLLDYEPMYNICERSGAYLYSEKEGGGNYGPTDPPPDYIHFQELGQTFYVSQNEVDTTQITYNYYFGDRENLDGLPYGREWRPGHEFTLDDPGWVQNSGTHDFGDPYDESDIGLPDYGIRFSVMPQAIASKWGVRKDYRQLNTSQYVQTAFLMLAMGMRDLVNHDAFFDYTDRWAQEAADAEGYNFEPGSWLIETPLRAEYREDYGPVWSPDPNPDEQ